MHPCRAPFRPRPLRSGAIDYPLDYPLVTPAQIDSKSEAVLLPVYGVLVPFHITTIKNVTTTNDATGEAALVRRREGVRGYRMYRGGG